MMRFSVFITDKEAVTTKVGTEAWRHDGHDGKTGNSLGMSFSPTQRLLTVITRRYNTRECVAIVWSSDRINTIHSILPTLLMLVFLVANKWLVIGDGLKGIMVFF